MDLLFDAFEGWLRETKAAVAVHARLKVPYELGETFD